jgi:glycosyltransferase involved in cell wall biosynthesis
VLFILHLAPPVHGASVVGSYIKESNLINTNFETNYLNMSTAYSLEDIGKASVQKLGDIFRLYVQIVIYLLKNKVDLCYLTINANGLAWLKELVIVAILKLFRVPIIYHYHNKGVRLNANSFWKKTLYRFQFKDSKSILLSSLLVEDIAQFVRKKDIYICANGIPEVSHLLKNKMDEGICQILFFSNLIETKGVYVLLEACKILKDKNIRFRCVFIGGEGNISGTQLDEKISQYGLQAFVEYQGKKYDKEKELAFLESDIFVLPTYYPCECFPLVNIEAMQYALPVISTREGGIPDVVVDGVNGFLIPNQNSIALAEKLEILIGNPALRNTMGLAGRRMYVEKFTLKIFENRMVEILHDCLKEKIA